MKFGVAILNLRTKEYEELHKFAVAVELILFNLQENKNAGFFFCWNESLGISAIDELIQF